MNYQLQEYIKEEIKYYYRHYRKQIMGIVSMSLLIPFFVWVMKEDSCLDNNNDNSQPSTTVKKTENQFPVFDTESTYFGYVNQQQQTR